VPRGKSETFRSTYFSRPSHFCVKSMKLRFSPFFYSLRISFNLFCSLSSNVLVIFVYLFQLVLNLYQLLISTEYPYNRFFFQSSNTFFCLYCLIAFVSLIILMKAQKIPSFFFLTSLVCVLMVPEQNT